MPLLTPPKHGGDPHLSPEREELEALIEEARARARKRRRRYGAALALGALAATGLHLGFSGQAIPRQRPGTQRPLPAGSASIRTCRTSQLKITTVRSGAGLGQAWAYIGLTNRSQAACELEGWPTLVAITKTGKASTAHNVSPSGFPATTAKIPAPIVKLAPGKRADVAFSAAEGAATRCPPSYRRLQVTPPGNTKSVLLSAWVQYLGAYLPDCSTIWVSPVVPPTYLQKG
jgi:hypothetical protein